MYKYYNVSRSVRFYSTYSRSLIIFVLICSSYFYPGIVNRPLNAASHFGGKHPHC